MHKPGFIPKLGGYIFFEITYEQMKNFHNQ